MSDIQSLMNSVDIHTHADGDKSITLISPNPLTVDQVREKCQLSEDHWDIIPVKIKPFTQTSKSDDGLNQVLNWSQEFKVLPKKSDPIENALLELASRPAVRKKMPVLSRTKREKVMDMPSFYDMHFAKYCYAPETGEDYDLEIARDLMVGAMQMHKDRNLTGNVNINKFVIPVGHDFFHVDSSKMKTFNDTPQDTDTRYQKMFQVGGQAIIDVIDMARDIAPVEVVLVQGNHDKTAAFHLCRYLSAWYKSDRAVTVDAEWRQRKSFIYGDTWFGMTHHCNEKQKSVSELSWLFFKEGDMESRAAFASARNHELLTGHLHKAQVLEFLSLDDFRIVYRRLPSMTAADAWHYESGYVGQKRACHVLRYGESSGYNATFEIPSYLLLDKK